MPEARAVLSSALSRALHAIVPESSDSAGGTNGSQQGLLMRKPAVNAGGMIAVVNSSFREGQRNRAWLVRGTLDACWDKPAGKTDRDPGAWPTPLPRRVTAEG